MWLMASFGSVTKLAKASQSLLRSDKKLDFAIGQSLLVTFVSLWADRSSYSLLPIGDLLQHVSVISDTYSSAHSYPRGEYMRVLNPILSNMLSFSRRINLSLISAQHPYLSRDLFPQLIGSSLIGFIDTIGTVMMCGVRIVMPSRICYRSFI
jgi:hypothetical protein